MPRSNAARALDGPRVRCRVDRHDIAGQQRVEQADRVEQRGDHVAPGSRDERPVDADLEHHVGGHRLVAVVEVRGEVEDVVVRALGVQDEEPVLDRVEVDGHGVVAEAGVQPRGGAHAGALVGAVDDDRVGEAAGPDPDAVGEGAGRGGPPRDARRCQADHEDLAVRREVAVAATRPGRGVA